jgi:hypothetical protein
MNSITFGAALGALLALVIVLTALPYLPPPPGGW